MYGLGYFNKMRGFTFSSTQIQHNTETSPFACWGC